VRCGYRHYGRRISRTDNLQDNLRSIYIDLRAISMDQNIAMLTATQTNRDSCQGRNGQSDRRW
jgi:replicative DNA helicase